jgi:tetratricopeptide (TPR) repeat protein
LSADFEILPPPNNSVVFESLCLDLWKELWRYPNAQKNGRSGQPQAGVDVFGQQHEQWVGVQCKQKDNPLWVKVNVKELETEVEKALNFRPQLASFILATTGPADAEVQQRARELTEMHKKKGLFSVSVWSWREIWNAIYQDSKLLERIGPIYWPRLWKTFDPNRERKKQENIEPIISATRIPFGAEKLFGREDELTLLDKAWNDPAKHILSIVAWGGVGKTSLTVEWMARKAATGWGSFDRVFDWSFYSHGSRDQGAASSDAFIAAALVFFGDASLAQSNASPWDKGARLAQLIGRERSLLVLDGLEPLQHPPGPQGGKIHDGAVGALLRGIARQNSGLCIVTTRQRIADLAQFHNTTVSEFNLQHLSVPASIAFLKSLGVLGDELHFQQLAKDVGGHSLTLDLLGRYLALAHSGDIRKRDLVDFQEADREIEGGHAFRVIAAYEKWLGGNTANGQRQIAVLRLLGLFDRPATPNCLDLLGRKPAIPGLTDILVGVSEPDWNIILRRLSECGLIALSEIINGPSERSRRIDTHPLIRQYFARQLCEQQPKAWRKAHARLYRHFKDTTKQEPMTVEGLQPLYQAVVHGCQAKFYDEAAREVFFRRIERGNQFFASEKLGTLGLNLTAVTCFFQQPWTRLASGINPNIQAMLLNEAGYLLHHLGRSAEAVEPYRSSMALCVKLQDWKEAAIRAQNLSELHLALGEFDKALVYANQGVEHADRSRDPYWRMGLRASLGDALCQAGRHDAALRSFRSAETLHARGISPSLPLFGWFGSLYCDMFLMQAERASWLAQLGTANTLEDFNVIGAGPIIPYWVEICNNVEKRASESLRLCGDQVGVYQIALDRLTIARARFYRSCVDFSTSQVRDSEILSLINDSLEGFRRSSHQQFITAGLMARGWLCFRMGDAVSAANDLNEAWEIAERSLMLLQMAQIHLHRGRLFQDKEELRKARAIVEHCGYWRRKEELEDAEQAAKNWA